MANSTTNHERNGIECPKCGHGSGIHRTTNYVSWMKRIRVCKNPKCLYAWPTKEIMMRDEDRADDLFSNA